MRLLGVHDLKLPVVLILLAAGPASSAAPREILHEIALAEDAREFNGSRFSSFLRNPDPQVRRRAVVALGRIQNPLAISFLVPLLNDSDLSVRTATIFALGEIGSQTTVSEISARLGDADPTVTAHALVALAKTGNNSVAPRIAAYLRGGDATLRAQAAFALSRLGDSTAVPSLVEALGDSVAEVRGQALHALERIGDRRAAPAALPLGLDPDPSVRSFALRAIGKLGGELPETEALVTPLDRGLKESDWRLRALAARACGDTRAKSMTPALLTAFADPSTNVREAAVAAVGEMPPLDEALEEQTRGALAGLAKDPLPGIRFRAGASLAKRTGSAGLERLRPFLDDPDPFVASRVIGSLGPVAPFGSFGTSGAPRDEGFLPLLRRRAVSGPPMVRASALQAIAAFGDSTDQPVFIEALRDSDWVVAAVAAEALADVGNAEAIAPLEKAYRARKGAAEAEVRQTIATTIGRIGHESEAAFLREALADEEYVVRRAATEALAKISVGQPMPPRGPSTQASSGGPDFGLPLGRLAARIVTERGPIVVELFGDESPGTVANFRSLAGKGFYDGIRFHRVVPNFVIQAGCPRGDGWGSAGSTIRCEINERRYGTGALGMAHSGKDTGGSQFFITHSPQYHLDGRYTLFGQVAEGQDVVDAITEGDRIVSIQQIDAKDLPNEVGRAAAEAADMTRKTGDGGD